MTALEKIMDAYPDEMFVKADGFDAAVIGVDWNMRLIYSVKICVQCLMRDMNYEEASEYFNYNVAGSYVGEKTPIWCDDTF